MLIFSGKFIFSCPFAVYIYIEKICFEIKFYFCFDPKIKERNNEINFNEFGVKKIQII